MAEQRCRHQVDLLAKKCSRRCKQAGVIYEMLCNSVASDGTRCIANSTVTRFMWMFEWHKLCLSSALWQQNVAMWLSELQLFNRHPSGYNCCPVDTPWRFNLQPWVHVGNAVWQDPWHTSRQHVCTYYTYRALLYIVGLTRQFLHEQH
jgi:hypothetical protein